VTDLHKFLLAAPFLMMPALAHHSFDMFDRSQNIQLPAVIDKFEFKNPHAWLWIRVTNAQGQPEVWGLETGGPSLLNRLGVTRHTFNPGDKVTITYHPMRSGDHGGEFVGAVLSDGTRIDMIDRLKNFSSGN
jgi:hypothetical protein